MRYETMMNERQNKLLICGADAARRVEMTELLERIGMGTVDEAGDFTAASRMISDHMYELVVCDTSIGSGEAMQIAKDFIGADKVRSVAHAPDTGGVMPA